MSPRAVGKAFSRRARRTPSAGAMRIARSRPSSPRSFEIGSGPGDAVAVTDVPQAQPVGRRRLARHAPVARAEDGRQLTGTLAAQPNLDDGADDRAHHLVAEGIGSDLKAQNSVAEVAPAQLAHVAHQGGLRRRPAAERREVVLAVERIAR